MSTRSSISSLITSNLPDNTSQYITPARLRQVVDALNASNANLDTDVPSGLISTNNEVTRTALQTAISGSTLKPKSFYLITNAVGSTRVLMTQASAVNTLYSYAVDVATGQMGTYNISTDAFTIAGASDAILRATASGTDTYTASISGITSYTDGDAYLIRFTNGNTTGATLNINSLGAKTLYRNNDGALIGGDIWAGAEMLCIYNSTLNGFQLIGTSSNSLFTYVTNAEASTITKGQPVYVFGGTGDRITVKLASNTSDATSAQTIGIVLSASIGANQKGIIITQGQLDGLSIFPTSTWADGDFVYLGATAGTITKTKPYAPNHLVYLGYVTTANNGSAGRMYVKVQNGYELDEIHDVSAQSPSNNNGLFFNSSTGLWTARAVAATDIDANVSNTEFGYLDGVTSAIQTQLNGKEATITTLPVSKGGTNSGTALNNNRIMRSSSGAIVEAAAITASRALKSDANGIPVHFDTATEPSLTELTYVKGVTSAIQTQIDGKQATITGGATTITSSNLTASRALASDASGKVAVSAVTSTELGYVSGVTSAIQTQLDSKQTAILSFNRQTASYTLATSDVNKMVEMNVASANNLTVPLNSSVSIAVGSIIMVSQYGAGQTTIVAASGVTLRSVGSWLKLSARYGVVSLVKVATDEWYVYGALTA